MAWDDTKEIGGELPHNEWNDMVTYVKSVVHYKGTATITAGNTYIDVAHGAPSTPTEILISPKELEGTIFYYDTVGATTFRINIGYAQSIDTHFSWRAYV